MKLEMMEEKEMLRVGIAFAILMGMGKEILEVDPLDIIMRFQLAWGDNQVWNMDDNQHRIYNKYFESWKGW